MESDLVESVLTQEDGEVIGYVVRLEEVAHRIHADVLFILSVVRSTKHLLHFLFKPLQGPLHFFAVFVCVKHNNSFIIILLYNKNRPHSADFIIILLSLQSRLQL